MSKGPAALAAVLLLLALGACNSLTSESAGRLASYLDNAEQYYEAQDYSRAFQQWGAALSLDSSNIYAQLGQTMCLYQLGRLEQKEAMKPLGEATARIELLRSEDFGRDQWKVDLATALIQQRWADLCERKLRKLAEDEKKGLPPDVEMKKLAKDEFDKHVAQSERAFQSVLAGEEKAPRDRLTCWVGLAQISYWRGDFLKTLEYVQHYLDQVTRSENLWKTAAEKQPSAAAVYQGKFTGAQLQEAELRDLRGAVLFQLGRVDEAAVEVEQMIKMFPDRAPPYLNRGVIRQMRGDDDLARGDYRKFLVLTNLPETDPTIVEATRRLAEVEERLAAQDARDRGTAPPR